MCGISGILGLNNSVLHDKDLGRLDIMLGNMYHRGPDGEGKKLLPHSMFGMRRLAIIDLEGGQQPISNEDENIWVVMNGEIYNYVELRNELINKGHHFKTHSDTEVIVHLYEEHGRDFVLKLNGMFAIFLLDQKKNEQYLFRDHMGIKPLFYTIFENRFIFSSDLTGLASITNAKLSKTSILSYLGLSYIPKPASIYEGINKLMPGSAIRFSPNGTFEFYTYWNLKSSIITDIPYLDARQRITDLLIESNSIQLRSDSDFAISLSGGIDSSAVLALASLSYEKTLNTISMGFKDKYDSKDVNYAEIIAKKYKTNHFTINLESSQYFEYLEEIMPKIDEPIADSALIPNYIISKEARKKGIKVLLSGAGGDELFGGYARHVLPSYSSARGLVRYPQTLRMIGYNLLNLTQPFGNNERLKHPVLAFASDINGLNYSFLKKIIKPVQYQLLIEKTMDHYKEVSQEIESYEQRSMLNDSNNYLVDNILSLSDKSSMAASIEGRFPIIDYRIAELAFSLPTSYTMHKGIHKGMLKEIISPFVPSEIINRKKEGYNAPIQQWFGISKVKEIEKYILINSRERLSEFIDSEALARLINNKVVGSKSFENIYNIYFLIKWMECHGK